MLKYGFVIFSEYHLIFFSQGEVYFAVSAAVLQICVYNDMTFPGVQAIFKKNVFEVNYNILYIRTVNSIKYSANI